MAEIRCNVLLVEDNPDHATLMEHFFLVMDSVTLETTWVDTLQDALQQARQGDYDIVLLDLVLPDSKGLDTFIKFHQQNPHLPIVVNSSLSDESLAIEAVQLGAQDYLLKGEINPTILKRAILYALVRHEKDENLRQQALMDELSQLYNRRGFITIFDQCRKLAQREQKELILIMVDVDSLKGINDAYGHGEGDRAIIDTGRILRQTFRSSDLIARIGGDEFVVLAVATGEENTQGIRRRLQSQLDAYNRQNLNFNLSLSVGIYRFNPAQPASVEALLERADQDLYDQKRRKKYPPKS